MSEVIFALKKYQTFYLEERKKEKILIARLQIEDCTQIDSNRQVLEKVAPVLMYMTICARCFILQGNNMIDNMNVFVTSFSKFFMFSGW